MQWRLCSSNRHPSLALTASWICALMLISKASSCFAKYRYDAAVADARTARSQRERESTPNAVTLRACDERVTAVQRELHEQTAIDEPLRAEPERAGTDVDALLAD